MTQPANHGLSTHVLNITDGLPAVGVLVHCQLLKGDTWSDLHTARTDGEGRVRNFLGSANLNAGNYKLIFATGAWFAEKNIETFFPTVAIEFRVTNATRHHHVPLLLSPFGYSTYRGS